MSQRQKKRPLAEINVVPYIDVMLVLLVIFMITAPLLTQGVKVALPQTRAKKLAINNELPIVVSVDRQGHFYLNVSEHPNKPLNGQILMTQVAARLTIAKQKNQHKAIYVKGDTNADYGTIIRAMVLLQRAGADDIGLITEPLKS